MSPASIVTGSPSMARRIEMPEGPPAPVTSTRGESDGIAYPRGGGERRGVAVAHHLERLHVARLAEARPVAGGRAQQLLVEVLADPDLRPEGADDLDLALEEVVDRDEARRLELDAGGGRLVTEHARDAAGGDQRRAVCIAVILVDVADRVRVDRRRPDVLDHVEDRAD